VGAPAATRKICGALRAAGVEVWLEGTARANAGGHSAFGTCSPEASQVH
jgi:hypothetical protein